MKSQEIHLLGLYAAMVDDCRRYYPGDAREWSRDLTRLRSAVESRGSKFLTIELPNLGKHFDRCLSRGSYSTPRDMDKLSFMSRRRGEILPKLFWALTSRIFYRHSGVLRPDVDVMAISLLRQLLFAAKKVRIANEPRTTFEAVRKFFNVEEECRRPSYCWDCDNLLGDSQPVPTLWDGSEEPYDVDILPLPLSDKYRRSSSGSDSTGNDRPLKRYASYLPIWEDVLSDGTCEVVQQVADCLAIDIGLMSLSDFRPKHGPGAVSDLSLGVSKYSFPNWPMKLELEFPSDEFAVPNSGFLDGSEGDESGPRLSRHEPPSKLIAVPKTQKGPRLIASEPTAHQWGQQAIRAALLDRWQSLFVSKSVDFFDQSLSQRAVLQASAKGSGASIDLSSASDRLSCWVVERFFRKNESFLKALHSTRTRWLSNGIDKKLPQFIKLKKFAPMGSAMTFPVQSMVYATVAIAVRMYTNGYRAGDANHRVSLATVRNLAREAASHVRVFGDDLIVPEEDALRVIEVLTYLGLEVNEDKTYIGGDFYESCGVDAYKGVDVTPTYFLEVPVESAPTSVISAIESSNNFHKCGMWSTSNWIAGLIPDRIRSDLLIKPVGCGAFGLESFCGFDVSHLGKKWNEDLHKDEFYFWAPYTRTQKKKTEGTYSLLQYFTEGPEPSEDGVLPPWQAGIPGRVRTRLRMHRESLDVTS